MSIINDRFGLDLEESTLRKFYHRSLVKYGVSSYQYVQAMNEQSFQTVRMFAVKLAKMINEPDLNIVYFDEAGFNLWLRHRKTWGLQGRPVKMVLNKIRGKGVTVFGAIGVHMPKPLFVMERTTNAHNFMRFLKRLRRMFADDGRPIHMVLDNHRAHHTLQAKAYAVKKDIVFHFMPSYSPELNAIEPLWSVLKRDFKRRMLDHRVDRVEEHFFRQILSQTLEAISPETQRRAARFNNRRFLLRCIEELLAEAPRPMEESKSDSNRDLNDVERRLMQSFVSASANELDQHGDSESHEDELSSIAGSDSPFSSDDDAPGVNNMSALNSSKAERNA